MQTQGLKLSPSTLMVVIVNMDHLPINVYI